MLMCRGLYRSITQEVRREFNATRIGFTLTCFKSWDQRLSSGLLLNFMPTLLFQFRFASTEQSPLDVPQGFGSGVVCWFDAHVHGRTPLQVPLRSC